MLGRGLDPFVREEVRSEMILAVLDGYFGTGETTPQTAREFVSDHHREAVTWANRSVDVPMFSDSGRSLHV